MERRIFERKKMFLIEQVDQNRSKMRYSMHSDDEIVPYYIVSSTRKYLFSEYIQNF